MSNWEHASEADIAAARDAYHPSDPKHPDFSELVGYAEDRKEAMELEVLDHEPDIILFTGNPAERMKQMQETAAILAEPVRQRHTVTIQGREHVRVEGWTMLGALLGVHPYLVWSRPIGIDEPGFDTIQTGWEARVEARTIDGRVVGSAEAMCTRHEKAWQGRDDYAIRSMAQTRATSKALRQPLGFVITLAGFDPTPAEEIPHDQGSPFKAPKDRVRGPDGEYEDVKDYLTQGQQKKLYALRSKLVKAGVFTEDVFTESVGKEYEADINNLTRAQASELIDRLEQAEKKAEQKDDKRGLSETQ